MKFRRKEEEEFNAEGRELSDFVLYYNKNIPPIFPRASKPLLEKFKEEHSSLFDKKGLWTVDKHRKKLMDWLGSHKAKE